MATYRKERNFIYFSVEGKSGDYRLDINTGEFLGLRGKPLTSIPSRSEILRSLPAFDWRGEGDTNLLHLIYELINRHCSTAIFSNCAEELKTADRIDSLTNRFFGISYHMMSDLTKEFADFVKWWHTNPTEGEATYHDFLVWNKQRKLKAKYGAVLDEMTAEQVNAILQYRNDYTTEELSVCAYYLNRGKLWEYNHRDVSRLSVYIEMCRAMDKKPEKVNNFMREYVETQREYTLRKTEFDNNRMRNNYAGHAKAWEFEYGDFTVVIPTCGQDIVDEGKNMHHCVGSYVDRVIRGETFICFIRKKSAPDECYLTCQVTKGEIRQYYLAYDRLISSDEDIAFKEAYAEHLKAVWGE
jgi:hypothetical protein